MKNSVKGGIIQSLDIITANAEAVIDEVAELKAFISETQREEATKQNKCSVIQQKAKKTRKTANGTIIID